LSAQGIDLGVDNILDDLITFCLKLIGGDGNYPAKEGTDEGQHKQIG
jgi:hypothetical protein